MPEMLQISGVTKRYGAFTLLEDATASLSTDQKIGMIGRNGAGKSTLCKVIMGVEEPDAGQIVKSSRLRVSYLEQHDPYKPDESIVDFLMRYTGKEEWECGEIAAKFQITYEMLEKKVSSLPGGYRTRVKLAAMLLRDPNFLILDEPTNYLDLSTLILLENFLLDFNGGYVIVSHDREFLKRTCDHTLEIENGGLTLYPGGIEEYFEFKEEQLAQKLAYNKAIEKKKTQLQEFVDRFKARASTATRAKSKMKQISKLKTIEIAHRADSVRIRIPEVENKAGIALSVDALTVGYPERTIASNISLEIDRGAKVAVLGDNGQGKTTFLRTIAGDLKPLEGAFKWGTGLTIGYYAQHVFSSLHPSDDIYAHLSRNAAPGIVNQDILDMAGCFLFKGDDVRKKVSVLSGGERARLCLAGLLLSRCQILLLDEPTNHLDFETVESLAKALEDYAGTVFFISHDRTFVNLIATTIIEVKDGRIKKYPGVYEDYVYHLECQAREIYGIRDGDGAEGDEDPARRTKDSAVSVDPAALKAAQEEAAQAEKKKIRAEIEKLQKDLTKVDARLSHYQKERDQIHKEIQNNPFNYKRERRERLKELESLIQETESEWLGMSQKLEELKKKSS